mmetsp:Transcript_7750/g.16845  ORF Transcript_7750/g.16845 Transcript_7750/m.16845 type:complete len:98 (-) Transcript_7750:38-331(-)
MDLDLPRFNSDKGRCLVIDGIVFVRVCEGDTWNANVSTACICTVAMTKAIETIIILNMMRMKLWLCFLRYLNPCIESSLKFLLSVSLHCFLLRLLVH